MLSVIIPAYKNTEELVQNLKVNLPYLEGCEVIVVNDDPEKSIRDRLQNFNVTLVENKKNLGFAGAINTGVEKSSEKYVMFLNSDVILHNSSYKKALKHFEENKNLFAVTFLQKEINGKTVGKNKIYWELGLLKHRVASDMVTGISAWAEGGSSVFDKDKFLKLGSMDTLYSPFYWEDIDLSYRAWKAGYEVLFDATITVTHHHESTIGKFYDAKRIKRIAFRNQHIFTIKNITDTPLILAYWILLLPNFFYFLIKGKFLFIVGFFDAISKIYKIAEHRRRQKKYFILQDGKILSKF